MIKKFTPENLDESVELEDGEAPPAKLANIFEGYVDCTIPSYPERLRIPKEIGLDDALTHVENESKVRSSLKQLELLAKCAERIERYLTKVSLVHKPTGEKLETVEDLYSFPEAGAIISAICTKFISGFLTKK